MKPSTAADFLRDAKIEDYVDSEGRVLTIRSIRNSDFGISVFDIANELADDPSELVDQTKRLEFVKNLSEEKQNRLLERLSEDIKRNVCKAVQNIKLVNKRQHECNEDIGEVSIDNLSDVDVYDIWRRVSVISGQPDPAETVLNAEKQLSNSKQK